MVERGVTVEGVSGTEAGGKLSRAEWALLLILATAQFTHSMDFMILLPLGAHCRDELGISPSQFGYLVAAYGFSAAIAGLLAAWVIDRFDRKPTLLTLYGGLTAGTLLCALLPGYLGLMLARSVAGAFGGILAAFILVIIGDSFPENRRGRATGVVMTAFSVASIAGLPAGILFGDRFGVRSPFGALGIFSLVALVVAYRALPPLRGHLDHPRDSATETWAILRRPAHLRAYVFMIMLVMGSFTISPQFSDFLVHNVGRTQDEVAYVYLFGGLLTFVTMSWVGRLADRLGKRPVFRVMAAATVVVLLGLTNLPAVPLVPVLAVTTVYFVVTSGRWVPAMAMITSTALPRYRGRFMSVNASVQQMSCGLASVVAGLVVDAGPDQHITGYATAGLIAAGCTLISMVLAARIRPAEEEVAGLEADATAPEREVTPAFSGLFE